MENIDFATIIWIAILIYFVPSILALMRGKRNLLAIFLLNFFGGWTLWGWLIALVWAATHDIHPQYKE